MCNKKEETCPICGLYIPKNSLVGVSNRRIKYHYNCLIKSNFESLKEEKNEAS